VPFESEADRIAEALRRELEKEREAHAGTEAARSELAAELEAVRKKLEHDLKVARRDVERRDAELEHFRPRLRLPLGWFPFPVLGAIVLAIVTLALGVGALTAATRNEGRIERLRKERDELAAISTRETKARRGAQKATIEESCLTACGCPAGEGCIGEVCREGVSPAYCCERAPCPTGAACQRFDGSETTCP